MSRKAVYSWKKYTEAVLSEFFLSDFLKIQKSGT